MKLPRYLIVALAITLGLVVWSLFSTDEETIPAPLMPLPTLGKVARPVAADTKKEDKFVDLFPVRLPPEIPVSHAKKSQSAQKKDPTFPLKAVGAWWENGERVVILSDGELNILLCKQCQIKGAVRPGHVIVPTWQLTTLSNDHLTVEWQPERIIKRIELGDLTSKPVK